MQHYRVTLNGNPVGDVALKQEGLYCLVDCLCRNIGDQIYRLTAQSEYGCVSLGVCVPCKEGFAVRTRISRRRLGEGQVSFCLTPCQEGHNAVCWLEEKKAFQELQCLDSMVCVISGSKLGLQLCKSKPDPGPEEDRIRD